MSLEGMDELVNKINLMGIKTSQAINPALKAAAEPILNEVQETTAYIDRTHKLRDSMKISGIKTVRGAKAIWVGDVDKQANYSWYVEFGHSKAQSNKNMSAKDKASGKMDMVTDAAPHPFMQPAYNHNKETCKEIMKTYLQEALRI